MLTANKMKILNLFLILIILTNLFGCAFEENREVEKKITDSINNFHALFNQERFNQIYSDTDEELKIKFTEQQFVSYLEVVKKNDVEEFKETPHIWLKDNLKDGIKRILFRKTKFSNVEIVSTANAIFREKFEWNLKDDEVKMTSYVLEKICNKPCQLNIKTK